MNSRYDGFVLNEQYIIQYIIEDQFSKENSRILFEIRSAKGNIFFLH